MKSIAIVVQRFGDDITGGAELHARMIAELLAPSYDVEVLTSCAIDYVRWSVDIPPGEYRFGGITVRRFAHPHRNDLGRARVPRVHKARFLLRKALRWFRGPIVPRPRDADPAYNGMDFLRRQGPHCEDLYAHLEQSRSRYAVVIFFTALYEPGAVGLLTWGGRSILVPLLHDEKAMYLPVHHDVFRKAGAVLFNTKAERALADRLYGIGQQHPVVGIGVELPTPGKDFSRQVLDRFGLAPGYIVYVGRIDTGKGCGELIDAFVQLAARRPAARLVLVGHAVMDVPAHPQITHTGFVAQAERDALIAQAAALVIPSRYESLSMVLLEAMLLGTPVVANGRSEVLAEHVESSGTGRAYRGRRELRASLDEALGLSPSQRAQAAERGRRYVESTYTWARVRSVFVDAIEHLSPA